MSLLYGMQNASHDSTSRKFLGKNIFTNAFPLSLANYIHLERGLDIPVVSATVGRDKEMDLANNATGRSVGQSYRTYDSASNRCEWLARNNRLVTLR